MSKAKAFVDAAANGFKKTWPKLAVGFGASLLVFGGYLLGTEIPKYKKEVKKKEEASGTKLKTGEKAKLAAKHLGPAACAIAGGAISLVASVCETDKRIAVGTTAVAVSEVATKNLTDYVSAAKEVVGEEKEKEIKKKAKEKRLEKTQPIVSMPDDGKYWCYDLKFGGKPFRTTEADLHYAENEINRRMLSGDDVSYNDLNELLHREQVEVGDAFGWRYSVMRTGRADLDISSMIKDNIPVFTISPNAMIIDGGKYGIPDYDY